VTASPSVNKAMILNREGVAFGKVVNFGVYQTTFTAEQHLEFDMF
jgi:hypothetical protein